MVLGIQKFTYTLIIVPGKTRTFFLCSILCGGLPVHFATPSSNVNHHHHQSNFDLGVARFNPAAISLTPTLHLTRFMASFFSKPTLLLSFSTCIFHASSCPSLQTPMLFSEHAHHPSSTHAPTISLHLPLPSEPLFPSILTSPSGPLFSFSPSALHHTLLSQSFLKLPSHFPSNTMSHSHITSLILPNSDKPFLSASVRSFLSSATPPIP